MYIIKCGIIFKSKGVDILSNYGFNLTLGNLRTLTMMFFDIFIIWFVIYYAIKIVRSNARTIQIFKGILLIVIIDVIAKLLGLKTLEFLANIFINWGFLAIIIIFQPEIRSILEKMGKTNVFSRITTLTGNEKENLVDQIVMATMLLSQDQTGALISIEQSQSLDDFISTGTKLNSDVTAELLTSIFVTSTPLHDGAVIIQGDKIACASAYFPPTNLDLPSRYGARHRAAIGISEITDAVTIVVSEETGLISITEGGKIIHVNRKQLRDYLLRVICGEETEIRATTDVASEVVHPGREVVIEEETKQEATGVLSKLAIKKQEAEIENEKIEVEEVITPDTDIHEELPVETKEKEPEKKEEPVVQIVEDKPEPKKEVKEPKQKKKFSLFGFGKKEKEKEKEEDVIEVLEEESADIKLPKNKKKVNQNPSYPEKKHPVEKETKEEVIVERPLVEEPKVQEVVEEVEEVEEPVNRRMSAEDVAKAREENLKKLSHNKTQTKEKEKKQPKVDINQYTSKIDISKIENLTKELDKALNKVNPTRNDEVDDTSSKGGDEQ